MEGFAKLAAPLHKVVTEFGCAKTGNKSIKCWTEECQRSFQVLKTRLTTTHVLGYADVSLPFILEVDRSHGGLRAVISQEQAGKVRPIAYTS